MIRPVLVVIALALTACSDGGPAESTTPQGTTDEAGALASFVLIEQSVASIQGFDAVVAQPLDTSAVFENPDPRGPCGGDSPSPPLEGTAGAVFAAPGLNIIQVVADGPDLDGFVDAQLADIAEPCGPYESATSVETIQAVDQIQVVRLPDDLGYFSTSRIENDGQIAFAASGLVRNGAGVTSLVFAVSVEPIPLVAVESLVRLIDAQLNAG